MAVASTAIAATAPEAGRIGELTGLPAEVADGVVKVSKPRSDLHEVVDGRPLKPFQGLTSWVAFQTSSDGTIAMGESELGGVLRALRAANLFVVAIHSHMAHEEPRILFLHYWGKGPAAELARGIRAARDTQGAHG